MKDLFVLMFHDINSIRFPSSGFSKPGVKQYTIDEQKFDKFVKFCTESLVEVLFTFDDGGSSFYNIAAPILEKYHKRGVFFISTSYIGTNRFLTKEQIKDLHSRGHIIASHSDTHPRDISKLTIDAIVEEWSMSKNILENIIGDVIKTASIPGGAVSSKVLKGLKLSGYEEVYTSEPTIQIKSFAGMRIIGRYTITNHSDINYLNNIFHKPYYRRQLILKYKFLRMIKYFLGSNYNKIKQVLVVHK